MYAMLCFGVCVHSASSSQDIRTVDVMLSTSFAAELPRRRMTPHQRCLERIRSSVITVHWHFTRYHGFRVQTLAWVGMVYLREQGVYRQCHILLGDLLLVSLHVSLQFPQTFSSELLHLELEVVQPTTVIWPIHTSN